MNTQNRCAGRRSPWLARLACLSAALLSFVASAQAQTTFLPAIGGTEGGQFIARCPEGELLTGFELRAGDDIDAIRPLCVTGYTTGEVTAALLTSGSGLITTYKSPLGTNFDLVNLQSGWYGGTGGHLTNVICPADQPIVTGMYVFAEGRKTVSINNIHLFCAGAAALQIQSDLPSAVFDAPKIQDVYAGTEDTERCPPGLVAVGINGRSGIWVDALGLICGPPTLRPVVKAIGRTKVAGAAGPTGPTGPPRSICDTAREARARNSPAAPGLEAQCRAAGAAGETPPVKAIGRVRVSSSPTDAPPLSICDAAREARARNSPAAAGLEAQCRAASEAALVAVNLAAKGEALATADPLAAELRNREPDDATRRGFDIGMAAAEGQTAPGPGKQRIHDSLSPSEQVGFTTAVAFSLERNRNAAFAATGAAIANVDPIVAEARTVDQDVFYWLGFDIATGIFGDPALGANGNTATGPGSLKIRDSLSAAGQRGFNAAVTLHLSRNYKP